MIEKVAEAHALRMAFADEVAGLNIEEEEYAIQDLTIESMKGTEQEKVTLHEDDKNSIKACKTKAAIKDLYESRRKSLDPNSKLAAMFYDACIQHANDLPE
jgi:hypothetical protein